MTKKTQFSKERRDFLKSTGLAATCLAAGNTLTGCTALERRQANVAGQRPNLLFIFADQWRAQATGYAGDPNAITPNLDELARQSINFNNAVSGCPVCSPYRASLITGRYPLSHGVFLNDVRLNDDAVSIAQAYSKAGYETGYIGKWHLDGDKRSAFIPRQRRQDFKFWKVLDCTHDYNNSFYYADENEKLRWQGYDAIAQTEAARQYIREHAKGSPFLLFLSWGPPHSPYDTAPERFRNLFDKKQLTLRPNVPKEHQARARKALAGYYAHIAALDDCIGKILRTLHELGLKENTILVFTSDHGDMLFSHGRQKKQQPWDESIKVPFLLRYPQAHGNKGRVVDMPINAPDIMPTLLGLSGIEIPATVEGRDFSNIIRAAEQPADNAALITCPSPFGQWTRAKGGREYRGLRTKRYTYVRDLNGPWLLYDNYKDPYQLDNLCNKPQYRKLQAKLDSALSRKLTRTNDNFKPGPEYIKKWGYAVDKSGTIPYSN
jgi:arylsulfatase A-like enzyme